MRTRQKRRKQYEAIAEAAALLLEAIEREHDLTHVDRIWIGHAHVHLDYCDGSDAVLVQFREPRK